MTESEQLTEGSYVYTDLGIEQVHWCEVNGEKELVTPKGYIHGEVPSVNRHFQLVGENAILIAKNTKFKELLKRIGKELSDCPTCVEGSWKAKLVDEIDQVLQENK